VCHGLCPIQLDFEIGKRCKCLINKLLDRGLDRLRTRAFPDRVNL
jgi:hypothetical protein